MRFALVSPCVYVSVCICVYQHVHTQIHAPPIFPSHGSAATSRTQNTHTKHCHLTSSPLTHLHTHLHTYTDPGNEMWTSAHINSRSFALAQQKGFMSLFDYISGANEGEKKIPMTSPVIFRAAAEGMCVFLCIYVCVYVKRYRARHVLCAHGLGLGFFFHCARHVQKHPSLTLTHALLAHTQTYTHTLTHKNRQRLGSLLLRPVQI